jgi:hypothetical protein
MITITIAGVDRTANVEYSSFALCRALTSQVDTLSFDVVRQGSSAYKPTILDTVYVLEGTTTIFGGHIVQVESIVADSSDIERFTCTCKDFSFDMDRTLVVEVYESKSVYQIIDDIVDSYLPFGYELVNLLPDGSVDTGFSKDLRYEIKFPVIDYIAFNYEQPSKCFQQLAQLVNYDWYVDHNKKIYFFAKTTLTAPFGLTDTSENYYFNTLKLKSDAVNIRNVITVRGGSYLGNLDKEEQVADGTQLNFLQAYQYNTVYVKVDSVSKTVGIDFIDDPADYDCLYNFAEKTVKFKAGTLPAAGKVVEVGGYPYIPLIIKVQDNPSIALYGKFEFKIVDKSLDTKAAARARGRAEITQWGYALVDGSFDTSASGLEVGQVINVQSTIRGVNQDYVISRINSKLKNGQEFVHSVTLMTTQTFGMIEFLQQLLIDKDKEIVINAGEVLESILSLSDTATLADAIGAPSITSPPYRYDSGVTILKWNFGTWS